MNTHQTAAVTSSLIPSRLFHPSYLFRYSLLIYLFLIIYASLYPMSGWRDQGMNIFAFITASFPRYFTWFDLATNFVAYLPLGLLAVLSIQPYLRSKLAIFPAIILGVTLSLLLEATQNFLPTRIPSNMDLLFNSLGTLVGAIVSWYYSGPLLDGQLYKLRQRWFESSKRTDWGLIVLGLWLFTQLNPAGLLFGNGDFRSYIQYREGISYPPKLFIRFEAGVVLCSIVGIGLLISSLIKKSPFNFGFFFLVVALAIKTFAVALLYKPENFLVWVTKGSIIGLILGVGVLALALKIPRARHLMVAIFVLAIATVLVNLAPANPYLTSSLQLWNQGQFLNFNGLTRLVSELWPFLALIYLTALAWHARKSRRSDQV